MRCHVASSQRPIRQADARPFNGQLFAWVVIFQDDPLPQKHAVHLCKILNDGWALACPDYLENGVCRSAMSVSRSGIYLRKQIDAEMQREQTPVLVADCNGIRFHCRVEVAGWPTQRSSVSQNRTLSSRVSLTASSNRSSVGIGTASAIARIMDTTDCAAGVG